MNVSMVIMCSYKFCIAFEQKVLIVHVSRFRNQLFLMSALEITKIEKKTHTYNE